MKATNRTVFTRSALAVAVSLASASSFGADLPTGGTITSGAGAISQSGDTLTVQQDSSRLISNWQSFNIGSGHTVNFQQPDNQAVALNRVIGEDASAIFGNLNANGKVFLINPNGVLFGQGASVNVGSLVASTLNLSDDDFLNERYTLRGDGDNAAVINRGHIQADNGAVALLGGHVSNQGVIQANMGTVALAAGNQVTLDFAGDGLLEVTVDESTIDALVENKELIRANGGQVLMTAKATDAVLETVVNNEGVIEAQTLQNQEGRILLLGGFDGGTVKVAGTLDASAPAAQNTGGGDGGFIDTSGAHVEVADGTVVNTLAANGQTGEWLIDPTDIVIDPGSAVLDNLDTTDVTLDTASAGSDPGNITFNTDINWSAGTTLTLNADNNIAINGDVSGAIGKLVLNAAGDIDVTGSVNLGVLDLISGNWTQIGASLASFSVNDFRLKEDTATFLRALAGDGTTNPYQIFDVYGLQGMESHSLLGSDFVLANDIDASGTVNWHAGAGFDPIGTGGQSFTGDFNGQGYIIDGLSIQRPTESLVGLFGTTNGARLRNVGLSDVSLVGYIGVGSLVGYAADTSIENSFASNGQVIAQVQAAGGLIGSGSGGSLQNSYADVAVRAEANGTFSGFAGGLLGGGSTNISNSYASGDVRSPGSQVGGLVGQYNGAGTISDSYATGQVSGSSAVGGVVGSMLDSASLSQVFWNQEANPGLNGVGSDAAATGVAGKTLTELQTLATFTGAGWDIDAEGGTGSVWRIYDGYTTPLLRGFLTALNVLPDYDGSGTHQNNIAGVDRTEWDAADASHLFGTPGSGDQLTLAGSDTAGEYLAYSDATANLYSDQQGYDLITTRTIVDNNVTNAGDIALTNGVSWDSGTLRIDTTGNISSIGAIEGGTGSVFDLISGNWTQVGNSLPSFSVNDFRLKEDTATFLRALAGNGTGADPYQIFDVYGLQGMESRSLLNSGFVQANDIDASGTVNWHAGAGFDPIGDFNAASFGGSFDGQGHEISDLTINRSSEEFIGLFGATATSATVANVGLVDSSITGDGQVGGLVGINDGVIRQSYVRGAGAINGGILVGGLVGNNRGTIDQSYATVVVTGSSSDVGGLVGQNQGTVSQSYATGAVSGDYQVGGLIGSIASGTVSQSYATGAVSGGSRVGGLVGRNATGTVTGNFFATTDANGDPINVGLSGIGFDGDPMMGAPSNTGAMPRTLVQLQDLSTFTAEGWDIDAEGGTGSVWRIYEGNTTPLLRAFLTELNVDATDTTYNGTYQNALWNIIGPYDASQVPGQIAGGGQDAGSYSVDMSGLYSTQQGYDLVADSNFVINKAAATVTANSDTVTYNGTGQSVTGFTATGLVNGEDESVLSGVITSGGSGTNAGSYTHTASGTDGNYTLTFVDGELTIDKAAAIVTANSDTTTYNGTSQSVTGFTATGLVNGETESVLSGVTTSGGTGTNAGSYAHTASGTDGNYTLTFVDGALTIDKAAATVTANSDTVTYNGTSQSVTGFTATGLVNGEDESVLSGVTTGGGTGTNAGSYTHTASGTDGNYILTFVDGALTIDKAAATVTANSDTVTYNGTSQSVTGFTATGLVNGEDESVLSGVTTSGGTGTNAGEYTHSASGTADNYLLTFVDGELTINKAAATVTANSDTVTYNGTGQSVTGFTATGLVNGETESVLSGVATSGGTGTNAGSYTHTASGSDGNYILTFVDGALTIDKANATVTANSDTVTYNGTSQSVTGFTATGLVNGEDESVLSGVTSSGGTGTNAGTYVHTASGVDGNYLLTFVDGELTIDKATATVTANSDTTTYNGTSQSVTGFTATGLVNGETESVLSGVTTSGGAGTNAGSYTHSASGVDGNYLLTFVDGALTINKAAATVTATSGTTTYNGTEQSVAGFTATGLVNGETESVLSGVATSGGTGTNAGSYAHTASGTDGNYILTFVDGELTIDKAAATVTANSDTVTYNGTGQSVTGFTATGLVNGEDESVLSGVTTTGGSGTNAGSYTHTASGVDGNYLLTFVDGKLTIDPASIQVSTTDVNRVYDGTTNADGTAVLVGGTLFGTDTLSGADFAFDDASAGTGKAVTVDNVTVTDGNGGNNYVVSTVNGTGSIGKRALTAEVTAQNKVFDGTHNVTLSGLLNGLVTGDDVSLILDGLFASSLAGDDVPVSFTALLAGADAGNYDLMLPATVDADILEFRSTEAYQSAMVSRPAEERRLSLPEEPEFVLQIDEDALRMSR